AFHVTGVQTCALPISTLGELTANISHEINNPLTIASGHCELLNEGLSSSDPMAKIDFLKLTATTIQDSLDRVNQIIRNMKSFLRSEERRVGKESKSGR